LACCIDREDPDFVYSDEDKLTPEGQFAQPFYKPDWSPDTMMSTMYTCHVSCVRRELANKVGGLNSEFDGAQDWDFVLRISEHTNKIAHIPKVLYHWRIIPASVASGFEAKPYVVEAARNLRYQALLRRGLPGRVEPLNQMPGYFRIHYSIQGEPLVSIIIPTKNNGAIVEKCVTSILERTDYRNFEIILLDNGSSDRESLDILSALAKHDKVEVISHDIPFNWSELNNTGARNSRGQLLLFLNDDTEIVEGSWLEQMAGYAQLPHIGAVGAKLVYPGRNLIQHIGVVNLADGPGHAFLKSDSHVPGYFARKFLEYNWVAVTGACLMVSRSIFEQVGGFDESFPIAYNDVEFCFRVLETGRFHVVCQGAELIHHESLTRGSDWEDEVKLRRLKNDKFRLYQKYPKYFMYDPFFNPNLHPNDVQFTVPN
jgi:O-antigen biosynthesis protein